MLLNFKKIFHPSNFPYCVITTNNATIQEGDFGICNVFGLMLSIVKPNLTLFQLVCSFVS